MADIATRTPENDLKRRRRAAERGRSMEEGARAILRKGRATEATA
jgi:plasmid stability protein